MATLTAPAVNWDSGAYPRTQSFVVSSSTINATANLLLTQNILVAPSASSLAPDNAVGYATSG